MKVGTILYYARIIPDANIYDVCELRVRTIKNDYFVGTDRRDKHAYLLSYNTLNVAVFEDREDALRLVLEEQDSHTFKQSEKYYEEY